VRCALCAGLSVTLKPAHRGELPKPACVERGACEPSWVKMNKKPSYVCGSCRIYGTARAGIIEEHTLIYVNSNAHSATQSRRDRTASTPTPRELSDTALRIYLVDYCY
jgi:hypothetical protein